MNGHDLGMAVLVALVFCGLFAGLGFWVRETFAPHGALVELPTSDTMPPP